MVPCTLITWMKGSNPSTVTITTRSFGNKQLFVEAYPIKKKYDASEGLDKCVREYGAPNKPVYDGGAEQVRRKN